MPDHLSNDNHVNCITIPVTFNCQFRGKKQRTVPLCFCMDSFDVRVNDDMLEPGKDASMLIKHFISHSGLGDSFCLLPIALIDNFPSTPSLLHYGIRMIDGNPTTACSHQYIALMPCSKVNAQRLIGESVHKAPFYIETNDGRVILNLLHQDGSLKAKLKNSSYAPNFWPGYGTDCIRIDYGCTYRFLFNIHDVNWENLIFRHSQ